MLQNDPAVLERAMQNLDPNDFWILYTGRDSKRKFGSTLERLQEYFGCLRHSAILPSREVIYQLQPTVIEKTWLLSQFSLPRRPACLPPEVRRLIVCFAGITEEIITAKNAEYFAPVIASFSAAGLSWATVTRPPYSGPEVEVIEEEEDDEEEDDDDEEVELIEVG
jgi:hypothetical protein